MNLERTFVFGNGLEALDQRLDRRLIELEWRLYREMQRLVPSRVPAVEVPRECRYIVVLVQMNEALWRLETDEYSHEQSPFLEGEYVHRYICATF